MYIGDWGCNWDSYHDVTGLGDFNRDGIGDLIGVRFGDGCLARWQGTATFGFNYIGTGGAAGMPSTG